jgi:hypothetical protein
VIAATGRSAASKVTPQSQVPDVVRCRRSVPAACSVPFGSAVFLDLREVARGLRHQEAPQAHGEEETPQAVEEDTRSAS